MKSKENYRFLLVVMTLVAMFGFIVIVRIQVSSEPTYAFPVSEDRL